MQIDKNKPVIVLNFKDYQDSTGEGAVALSRICEKLFKETSAQIVVAVHPFDLRNVIESCPGLFVICQTGDSYTRDEDGKVKATQTGRVTPRMILAAGAHGVLVNHAENPKTDAEVSQIIGDFELEDSKLLTIVCAEDATRAQEILELCKPDYIAVEPPDLIGGDVSVTTRPEVVSDAITKVMCPILVGAGVKTGEDVRQALELGARGVLLASGVVRPKSGSSEDVLRELINSIL